MAEAFRLGKIRKILMPVFRLRQSLDLRSRRSSGAGTPSARGLSNFRRLILRVRRRPSARWPEGIRGILNCQARC
jgi:hypothetical protein